MIPRKMESKWESITEKHQAIKKAMKINLKFPLFALLCGGLLLSACKRDDDPASDCEDVDQVEDLSIRGTCSEALNFSNQVSITISGNNRIITTNSIPDHLVGVFGGGSGSLNPNAIAEVNESYTISATPSIASTPTALLRVAEIV